MTGRNVEGTGFAKTDATKLAALLAPAEASFIWQSRDLAAVLRHQLQMKLPAHPSATLGELLLDPQPPVDALAELKEFAKAARRNADSGIPLEICHVLYYAAIVAASLRAQIRLTTLDDAALRRALEWAVAQQWLDEPFRLLLKQGLDNLATRNVH